jgi:hypothetical protein
MTESECEMITNYRIIDLGSDCCSVSFDYAGQSYRVMRNGKISVEYRREGYYSRYWVRRTLGDNSKIAKAIRFALAGQIETNHK